MPEDICQILKESYCSKGSFQHRKATLVRLFPYVTSSPSSHIEEELASGWGIGGELSRRIVGVQKAKRLDLETVKEPLRAAIETQDFQHLLDVIRKVAFNENGAISPFALSVIPYLDFSKESATLREMGTFLYDVLFDSSFPEGVPNPFEQQNGCNVLYDLIHRCLPPLVKLNDDTVQSPYYKVDVGLREVFATDWCFLIKNKSILHAYYPEFLKLYFLIYQLRAIERLSLFFEGKQLDPIFFTVDWESCSTSRIAYHGGWRRIEPKIKTLFSHVNCLEMLNHIDADGLAKPFDYQMLSNWAGSATDQAKEVFGEQLQQLCSFYKEQISDLANGKNWEGWDAYEPFPLKYKDNLLNQTQVFYEMVDCQFRNTHRNAPAGRYANWLIQFATLNFIKRRGRIGNTLAFSRDQIMFLARLAVGEKEKLRLKDFWNSLEKRGIAFDYESRRKIIELFERLSLLEKKSDSGDAQYVRAII
jgi:DNA phosphorothioation-dependent restriction protein DptG